MPQPSRYPVNLDLGTVLSFSSAGTGTSTSADLVNSYARGVQLNLNLANIATGTAAVATIAATIQGKDQASTHYYPIAGLTATNSGFATAMVYPGIATAAAAANGHLPQYFNVQAIITGSSPNVSGTLSAILLV
jgi:hypothetical protein